MSQCIRHGDRPAELVVIHGVDALQCVCCLYNISQRIILQRRDSTRRVHSRQQFTDQIITVFAGSALCIGFCENVAVLIIASGRGVAQSVLHFLQTSQSVIGIRAAVPFLIGLGNLIADRVIVYRHHAAQRVRALYQTIVVVVDEGVDSGLIIRNSDYISIAVIAHPGHKSGLVGGGNDSSGLIIAIGHAAFVRKGNLRDASHPVIGIRRGIALRVGHRKRQAQSLVIDHSHTVSAVVGSTGNVSLFVVLIERRMPQRVLRLELTVAAVVGVTSDAAFGIGLFDSVVVSVVLVGQRITQGVRS